MNRQKLKKIMEALDEIAFADGKEMELAMFMWMRYGDLFELTDEQLSEVQDILADAETLFDEGVLEEVERIVGF